MCQAVAATRDLPLAERSIDLARRRAVRAMVWACMRTQPAQSDCAEFEGRRPWTKGLSPRSCALRAAAEGQDGQDARCPGFWRPASYAPHLQRRGGRWCDRSLASLRITSSVSTTSYAIIFLI